MLGLLAEDSPSQMGREVSFCQLSTRYQARATSGDTRVLGLTKECILRASGQKVIANTLMVLLQNK